MPLDLRGFTTPASDFSQLSQIGDKMERRQYRADEQARQQKAQSAASAKFLTDYLNPKDHLTGSPYDPEVVAGFQDLLTEGMKLAGQGADMPTLMMALSPKVNKLDEYSQKAKYLTEQGKQFQSMVKGVKGIDVQKAADAYKNAAFYDVDPATGQRKLKDISDVDVEKNYADEVMRNGEIYNNEGISDWMKNAKPNVVSKDMKLYDSRGNLRQTKVDVSAPNFMVSDTDARGAHKEFVPDYDVATDEGNPILHEFQTEQGKVKAPVRMVKDYVFNDLPTAGKAYLLQEARRYAKTHGIDASSPQVENFAKALAYDEIKGSGKLASSYKEVVDNKPSAQQIKINLGIPLYKKGGGSGANGEVTINDVYDDIKTSVGKAQKGNGSPISELPDQAANVVMGMVRARLGNGATIGDAYLKDEDGKIVIKTNNKDFGIPEGTVIGTLTKTGVNLKAQVGAKEKRAVVSQGNTQTTTKFKGVPNGGF